MPENKRQLQRFVHDAHTQLTVNEDTIQVKLLDISLKGCLVALPEDWPPTEAGQTAQVCIVLADQVTIASQATLRHSHPNQTAGFTFDHIDLDSITNLRRLVELNLGNSEILERELDVLAGS